MNAFKNVYSLIFVVCTQRATTIIERYDSTKKDFELEARVNGDYSFAMTGRTWAIIRDKFPVLLPRILVKGAIFARMTSEQKQQLIQELQHIGYHVGKIKI